LTLSKNPSVLPPSGRRIQTRRSGVHGKGVFAVQPIAQGEKVIEYVGEVITWKEADRRHPHNPKDPNHTFYFHLDDKHVLDALYGGNSSRWINHACEPNCEADVEDKRVFIKALRDIQPGEELNYDYGLVIDSPLTPELKAEYACWAPSCRGTMLASSMDDDKKSNKKKKKKDKKKGHKAKDKRREQRRKAKRADKG
jgi:SET domain-containing protein